jgi:RNA polymerase sigma-70 factor (ECF subfamily)
MAVVMQNRSARSIDRQIWNEYRTRLHRFVRKRVTDRNLAEDIVQEVFVKAYAHLNELADRQKILPWLYQITRHAIVDHYRKHNSTEAFDESFVVADTNDAEAAKELASCMMPLIRRLPPDYREAVILSEIDGLLQKDVAAKQGLSLSGAKSRIQRGRKMLKALFLSCCKIEQGHRGSIVDYQPKRKCGNCQE